MSQCSKHAAYQTLEKGEDLRLRETLFREVHLVKRGLVQLACD